jgi:hypothetical protein
MFIAKNHGVLKRLSWSKRLVRRSLNSLHLVLMQTISSTSISWSSSEIGRIAPVFLVGLWQHKHSIWAKWPLPKRDCLSTTTKSVVVYIILYLTCVLILISWRFAQSISLLSVALWLLWVQGRSYVVGLYSFMGSFNYGTYKDQDCIRVAPSSSL